MAPVFGHGRLRLYLLVLLDEAPRHGYEVIRLLEERFQGLYAPSAGTVYPRLAKLEQEGLVTHTTEGGRKVYSLTDAGRGELAGRQEELADLEREIRESVSELAAEIREDVRGSARDLREEMRAAARQARSGNGRARQGGQGKEAKGEPWDGPWGDKEAWRQAKEEWRRAKQEMKEENRRAWEEAKQARRQAKEEQARTRDEVRRIKERVQEQIQDHLAHGDWPTGLIEGIKELSRELGSLAEPGRPAWFGGQPEETWTVEREAPPADLREPEWAKGDDALSKDPARDLERLLDRFRDDVRDAARDHGVTVEQLRDSRRHLSAAAAHIVAILRGGAAG
jgi:DNA-binding PadR family transcriptional regulator